MHSRKSLALKRSAKLLIFEKQNVNQMLEIFQKANIMDTDLRHLCVCESMLTFVDNYNSSYSEPDTSPKLPFNSHNNLPRGAN